MKVIHLISGGDVGGAKTHVHLLLQGLSKTQRIRLICFTDGPFVKEAAALGIETRVLDGGLPQTVRTLRDMIRQDGFEIIHCHGSKANMIGALLRKKTGLPVITTVHSDYRRDYMGRPLAALTYGTINKLALRRLDHWIGVSDATVDMLISRGFHPQQVFKIYNSVPFDDLSVAMNRDRFFESVGLSVPADGVVFGIAARISPVKDMETLVRAFARVAADCPNARLCIAGDGEERPRIEALAKALCPAGTYCFAGWLKDTASFYHAIDVNMLTSVSEGFPYALPEGARMRCATISSRVGGVPELIDDGYNGLLFSPKDLDALTGHMLRLVREPALREAMADRLFEKAKAEFSVEAMLRRQEEIYTSVLRRKARKGQQDGLMICGAYGKDNKGDDAILQVICRRFLAMDPDLPITVLSRNPLQTKLSTHVNALHTFSLPNIHRAMRRTRLYLSGGGSLIQDATSSRSLWYYLKSIQDAKRRGCQVMMFGCGIGPVSSPANRTRAARVISKYVDEITLRDEDSAAELTAMGVTGVPVSVTADPALLLPPAKPEQLLRCFHAWGLEEDEDYFLFAPRPWPGMKDHMEDFIRAGIHVREDLGMTPIFYAMEQARDLPVCQAIGAAVPGSLVLAAPKEPDLTVGLLTRVRGLVAMRLHALIFAAGQGVPFAGVVYDPKVSGFLDYIGQGDYCTLADCSGEVLCRLIDAMGQSSNPDRVRVLSELAVENFDLAAKRLFPSEQSIK